MTAAKADRQLQKKRLENKFNIWTYRGLLFASFYFAGHFLTGMTVNTIINHLNLIFGAQYGSLGYGFVIILRIFMAAAEVLVFEIAVRVVFFMAGLISFGAVTMSYKNFAGVMRLFVIAKNIALGILGIFYYYFNYIITPGIIVGGFIINTAAYFCFFLYIKKYYLDEKMVHRAFRALALIYLGYSLMTIMGGIL